MNMQTIQNSNDLQLLYQPLSLYLKPLANLTISLTLPSNITGKTISNFEVMDKLRQMILPDKFSILKVSKTTVENLRFEAELDDRTQMKNVVARLEGRQVKLNGISDYIKIKASEAKCGFPTRHDWDSFFRDAKNMDEMKAGERPDTVYLGGLPIKWFRPRSAENDEGAKPSETLFKRIFEKYGEVRVVDIPICDPYRTQMKSNMTGLRHYSYDNDMYFEGYVQFSEYGSFVRAMDEFRGMKLVRKEVDKNVAVNIQVTFDKTKHLSDASVKRRKVIRDRLIEKDREKAEEEAKKVREEQELKEKQRQEEEAHKKAELERQREREERRKQKYMKKISTTESSELTKKIRKEQKKLLETHRKIESIRLLEALMERIKVKYPSDDVGGPSKDFKGFDLRKKLSNKKKSADGLIDPKSIKKERSLSITSISSSDSILSGTKSSKKKRKRDSSTSSSSSSSSSSSTSDGKNRKKATQALPTGANGMYPFMYPNPETGEWFQGAPMYPMFAPGLIRQPYYNNNYRGPSRPYQPRSRGRGRGRGYYGSNYDRYYREDDYYKEYDDRRSYSRSPRRRRSYSRSRSRHRSYTRSKSRRRSRSYSKSSRSSGKSRSKSHNRKRSERSKSKLKLVTTLRDGDISKAPPSTRQNRSRSKSSGSGWSSSDGYRKSRKDRHRTWSRENSPRREKLALEPEKLLRSAREIQLHVQQKLREQQESEEKRQKELEEKEMSNGAELYQRRSTSVDSSKFQSPKRTAKSLTPELTT